MHTSRTNFLFLVAALFVLGGSSLSIAQQPVAKRSDWPKFEKVIEKHFTSIRGWHPQALIWQTNVETLWSELAKEGWKVPDTESVMKLVPRDDEFLSRQMRTTAGKRFMRDVAVKYPAVYDRLDRISRLPSGKVNMEGLIAAPDAMLTVKYMMSKEGTQSWASLLGEKDIFAKPTGRLYTAELLLAYLEHLYSTGADPTPTP